MAPTDYYHKEYPACLIFDDGKTRQHQPSSVHSMVSNSVNKESLIYPQGVADPKFGISVPEINTLHTLLYETVLIHGTDNVKIE